MQEMIINLSLPEKWEDLSQDQLKFIYKLVADGFDTDEIKSLCILKWNKISVIGRQPNGSYLVKRDKDYFDLSPLALAEVFSFLDFIDAFPNMPVRLKRIANKKAVPADFQGVCFESFIIADNLYQGYLSTQSDELLTEIAKVLYRKNNIKLKPYEKISIFYWMASLKHFFANKFPEFFQPAISNDDNLLGSSISVEEAMNAQIRALTKGDITKEEEILAMDTWRALTELNAQAKEYNEFNAKYNKK